MKIVIDHVRGSRRGQRQEFVGADRVVIGRHPKSDVTFDAHRDLDASSRHAELRLDGERYVLHDVGSSNGTFVGGQRIGELEVGGEQAVEVEFGAGGPVLRIWVGGDDATPEPRPGRGRRLGVGIAAALAVAAVVAVVALVLLG